MIEDTNVAKPNFNFEPEWFKRREEERKKEVQRIIDEMAPEGTLGLPPLLEKKRLSLGIADAVFTVQAVYDRILVWQLPAAYEMGETYGDTSIIMPENRRDMAVQETPRGVIVTAGLKALDNLRSNGMDVGHTVLFIKQAPWRWIFDKKHGRDYQLLIMRDGDLIASEDLHEALKEGTCKIKVEESMVDGTLIREHLFVDENGQTWNPADPFIPDDY